MITPNGFHLGAHKSPFDPRDYNLSAHPRAAAMATAPVRQYVDDLRGKLPNAWDQSFIGSCEAHGWTRAALPFWLETMPTFSPSRLAAYAWGRQQGGTPLSQDSGVISRDMAKVLVDGVYDEQVFPYEPAKFTQVPPDAERVFKISGYFKIDTPEQLAAYINAGHAASCAVNLPGTFEDPGPSGVIPLYAGGPLMGWHDFAIVGHDLRGVVPMAICTNSWGTSYGEGGHMYYPISMILDKAIGGDCWGVYRANNI